MKQDYIRGFAEKCAQHKIKAEDLVKEASRMEALAQILQALQDSYDGSSLQGAISDIGEGAGGIWDKVVDSAPAQALGDLGESAGGGIEDLISKLQAALGGGEGNVPTE